MSILLCVWGSSQMNILIAADYAAPASGNFIGSMMDLGKHLSANGSSISFVFPSSENTTRDGSWTRWLGKEGFRVFLIDMTQSLEDQFLFLRTIITECQIDILHLHFGLFHSLAIHRRDQLPVEIIIHEHMEYPAGCNHMKQSLRYMARSVVYRAKRIRVVSVNKTVDAAYCFARHYYIPNGLSFSRNNQSSLTREQCRSTLGFNADDKIVLFLGWDLYRKGLDIAIKAINECRKKDPNIILGLIGVGNSDECRYFIQNRTGISPDVPWIKQLHGGEDMFSYHRAADVYLSASRSEAFSYGLLEAISQNTPIVVSDIAGTRWSMEYNRSYSYPVEDPQKCAGAILDALADNHTDTTNAQEMIEKYSIENWIQRIEQVYTETMPRKKR